MEVLDYPLTGFVPHKNEILANYHADGSITLDDGCEYGHSITLTRAALLDLLQLYAQINRS